MKKILVTFVSALLSISLIGSASAFELSGNHWTAKAATYGVGIPGVSPSGVAYADAFKEAMTQWTQQTSFVFTSVDQYQDPCIDRGDGQFGDGESGVDFGANVCGNEFGSAVAIALTAGTCFDNSCTTGFDIKEADIVFKESVEWDVYDGPLRFNNTIDFRRVALHELGHGIGLRHEEDVPSIMAAKVNDLDVLQSDDIAAANTLYGGEIPTDFTTYQSKYGIRVRLPLNSVISTASSTFTIPGELDSSDGNVGGAFIDLHQITLEQDSRIVATATANGFNSFLYLARIDATQGLIASFVDSNSGPQGAARIEQNVQAGTYWIGVSSDNSAEVGSYELDILTTRNSENRSFETFVAKVGARVEINPNPNISGSLTSSDFDLDGNFTDLYQINVQSTTQVTVELDSDDFDTKLFVARILSGEQLDGSFFFVNNDTQGVNAARMDLTLTPGTYWLAPTSTVTGATGDYSLTFTVRI